MSSRSLDTTHRRLADDLNGQRDNDEAPDRLKPGGLAGRAESLFDEEDELAKRSSELALNRRELPWLPVMKNYAFDTGAGKKALADLFEGRPQLLIYHMMFGPD
ncbi:MAG TPA: DUF899 family protein [Candidatus Dormibacteraeota bacterium]